MQLLHANDAHGEHANSWYAATCELPTHASLETHRDADVCVIGAGYTGLAAAHELATRGHSVVVLDAHRVGWGASGRNGGQLGTGFNTDQQTLERKLGETRAHALWDLALEARRALLSLCEQQGTDVQYRSGVVTALHRARHLKSLHAYCEFLTRHYPDSQYEPLDRDGLRSMLASDDYHGGAIDHEAGHLHPLLLAGALARAAAEAGTTIFERSEVVRIETPPNDAPLRVVTALGSVRAERVVLAANGYLDGLVCDIGRQVMPINNFVLVTEPLGVRAQALLPGNHAVADSRFVVNYFRRTLDDRLLFGGGESYGYRFPVDPARLTRRAMLGVFPELADVRTDYAWGGTLAITRTRLPHVKRLTHRLYTAGGYSGHGVALASACGRALAQAIDGDDERLELLSALPVGRFPGGPKARPALLAVAMTGARWLDRL